MNSGYPLQLSRGKQREALSYPGPQKCTEKETLLYIKRCNKHVHTTTNGGANNACFPAHPAVPILFQAYLASLYLHQRTEREINEQRNFASTRFTVVDLDTCLARRSISAKMSTREALGSKHSEQLTLYAPQNPYAKPICIASK